MFSSLQSSLQESINDVSLIDSDVRDDTSLLMTEEDERREEKDEDHDDDLHERFTGKKDTLHVLPFLYPTLSFHSSRFMSSLEFSSSLLHLVYQMLGLPSLFCYLLLLSLNIMYHDSLMFEFRTHLFWPLKLSSILKGFQSIFL